MAGTVPITKSLKDIYTEDALPTQEKRWHNLLSQFKSTYGHSADFVSRSPGRVNILGEHIDYSLYGVLPMAITADVLLAVRVIDDSSAPDGFYSIKISNTQPHKFPTRQFDVPYASVEIDATVHEWTNYFKAGLKGALESVRKIQGEAFTPKSMEILLDGSVPSGGGLSSSAAFVSASALAGLYANSQRTVEKSTLTELAIISERSVGVNTGGMDQSASIFSLRGSALYVEFFPKLTARAVNFPKTTPELTFLIAQSFVQSDKHVTAPECYNLRVVECSLAASYLNAVVNTSGTTLPKDNGPLGISLRGFMEAYFSSSDSPSTSTLEEKLKIMINLTKKYLTKEEGYTRQEIASATSTTVEKLDQDFCTTFPVRAEKFRLQQRALHVYSEALRVLQFLSILENPQQTADHDTTQFNQALGSLMNDTQDSCRDLYECSCPELDELCAIARRAGAYGSRLTGAGWGGCSVHLVPANRVANVKEAWNKEYYNKEGLTEEQKEAAVVVSKPGSGSAVFLVDGTKGEGEL